MLDDNSNLEEKIEETYKSKLFRNDKEISNILIRKN